MQKSQLSPSLTKPTGKSRGKLVLALGILSLVLIPCYIMVTGIFIYLFPRFQYNDFFKNLLLAMIILIAPILGILGWLMANKDLRNIREGILPASARGLTKRGKIVGVVGAFVNPCIVIAFVLSLFAGGSVGSTYKDEMIPDLINIAADGYQYRIRPSSMGGGGGKYRGYTIPSKMASNENGTYELTNTTDDEITILGKSLRNSANTIQVTVNSEGKLTGWVHSE